jgi:hypothetical protein
VSEEGGKKRRGEREKGRKGEGEFVFSFISLNHLFQIRDFKQKTKLPFSFFLPFSSSPDSY